MTRIIALLMALGVLSACGTSGGADKDNPFQEDPEEGTNEQDQTEDDADSNPYGGELNDKLTMTNIEFDPTANGGAGELILDGMPFDGGENIYRVTGTLPAGGFDIYENIDGEADYYAVFGRTSNVQVAAAGTDFYITPTRGGNGAQRLSGSGRMAANQNYTFTGEYASVRSVRLADNSDSIIQFSTGDLELLVDTQDLDDGGSVIGQIQNRAIYDVNGNEITELFDIEFINLAETTIDSSDWTIVPGRAQTVPDDDDLTTSTSGQWTGIFAGPNGEEVAGIVVLEGTGVYDYDPVDDEFDSGQILETGAILGNR